MKQNWSNRILVFLAVMWLGAGHAQAADEAAKVKYAGVSLAGISDVFFRKGLLRADDPAAVEEYIRIHECGLYEQYASDDFAWTRIREAYARELQFRLKEFPDGLEIESSLQMDQYDLATNEFMIDPKAQMDRMGTIKLLDSEGGSYDPCPEIDNPAFVPRVHPLVLNVKIDVPLTLKGIPLDRSEADKLIAQMNKRLYTYEKDRRKVTLVMRVRLANADPLSNATDPTRRTIIGLLDDLRVYDGPEKQRLLFRRDYQTQREKTQKQSQ